MKLRERMHIIDKRHCCIWNLEECMGTL